MVKYFNGAACRERRHKVPQVEISNLSTLDFDSFRYHNGERVEEDDEKYEIISKDNKRILKVTKALSLEKITHIRMKADA